MNPAEPPSRPTPPRALAALSMALGLVFAVLVFGDLAARGPIERAPAGLVVRFAVVAVALNLGYLLAPLLAGRGLAGSFAAGLLLAFSVLGWVLMFWPGLLADPLRAALGGVAGAVLVALYAYVFRHLAAEFQDYRRGGGPPPG